MLVMYQGLDEVLVCTKEAERTMLRRWFSKGLRSKKDYIRDEISSGILQMIARLSSFMWVPDSKKRRAKSK